MRFSHLLVNNWRNFLTVDVDLTRRVFIVGPNAAGKSNLLDVFRFLRDIANPQGGLQRAVEDRTGVTQLRSLHARSRSQIVIEVTVENGDEGDRWLYRLELIQDSQRRPLVKREVIKRGKKILVDRPDREDDADSERLTQTYLEQVTANKDFRELAEFLGSVRYQHLVPQLVREGGRTLPRINDPYGSDFLDQLARTPKKTLNSRLRRILEALRVAVPQLRELELKQDERGVPHLLGLYEHWRPNAGWQNEEQFSDGTLRLMALLWILLDGTAPLLLEEPELSLHVAVVRHIPRIMARLGRKVGRQIIVSTHSADLLLDEGIGPEEVLMLEPSREGTKVRAASNDAEISALLNGGMPLADIVIPATAPRNHEQLSLFGE